MCPPFGDLKKLGYRQGKSPWADGARPAERADHALAGCSIAQNHRAACNSRAKAAAGKATA
jgi:hypothetical protein